ncbi:MAG TPA: glycosyltransferase family 9 protein [Candidatus Kapabacteria bacterium]|nr:glycosyltransferase family 9 protein [Candidatus Kapabacteria bacterium]
MPCKPHKDFGVKCETCPYYDKTVGTILIIKLGAIGDVIRTSTLLPKIKKEYPQHRIFWLTYSPDIIPSIVDKTFDYSVESLEILRAIEFDLVINLDKDMQAVALTNSLTYKELKGFNLKNNMPFYANELAKHKYLTGLFDDLNKKNTKSYPEEIFEICGWKFEGEDYIIDLDDSFEWNIPNDGKKIIGLNTGCGARWVSRLLPDNSWIELIKKLQHNGYYPLLLGGKQEDEKNKAFAEATGALYLGYFPLQQFISEVNQCDVVVSAVTMGMHIAIGLKKNLILMNNIFNPLEFELYGRGEIVMPDKECKCFFKPSCTNKEYFCLDYLNADKLYNSIIKWI